MWLCSINAVLDHKDTLKASILCMDYNRRTKELVIDGKLSNAYVFDYSTVLENTQNRNSKNEQFPIISSANSPSIKYSRKVVDNLASGFGKIRCHLIEGNFIGCVFKKIKKTFTKIRKQIDKGIGLIVRKIVYRKGEVNPHKIFFMTYDSHYSCNPRYITEELLSRNLPVEIVWVVPNIKTIPYEEFPPEVQLVKRGSYNMFEAQSNSKIWVDNALNCVWFGMPKKPGQVYLNTWHGSMGIKRLSGNRGWMCRAAQCNKLTDYCICNSTFEEDVFRSTFWSDVPVLKYGHARNDVFFQPDSCAELRKKAKEYFGVDEDTKLFLYAPTFRDNGTIDYEEVDYEALKNALEARFGGKWAILVRPHFKDRMRKRAIVVSEWLKDASNYGDMQELLPAIDVGMTDYSSWAYDYILMRRPLFYFAPDIANYDQGRGFYFSLESTGFPLAHNNAELLDVIKNFDAAAYQQKVAEFLENKGCYEEGRACERIVDKIVEILGVAPEGSTL